MLLRLLLVLVLVVSLFPKISGALALPWINGVVPHNARVPFAVRVAPASVARWASASQSVYGLTRVGQTDFMVSSVAYARNKDATRMRVQPASSESGVVAWAALADDASLRVAGTAADWPVSSTTAFVVRFIAKYTAKRGGGPARVAANMQPKCAKTTVTAGADADHYVVSAPAASLRDCALTMASAYPEIVHVSAVRVHHQHTAYASGPLEVLGGTSPALETGVGAGLVRAVMDLDGVDTTHCFFYDAANPVLYASAASVPVRLAPTEHEKFTGVVSVCTNNPAACGSAGSAGTAGAHATHVSGIAAGSPCGMHQGVAPASKLLVLAVPAASASTDALALPGNLFPALQTAAWANASSLTMSFGGPADGMYDDTAAQIDAFVLSSGATVTASVGNTAGGLPSSPAVARNVLSVAASVLIRPGASSWGPGVTQLSAASFSSNGALIAAPGVDVISALADPSAPPNHATFVVMDGTSMAAPMVPVQAAQGALAGYGFSAAPAALVRAMVIASAVPCDSEADVSSRTLVAGASGAKCGFGVPRLSPALTAATDPSWAFVTDSAPASPRFTACFSAAAPASVSASINATLVWNEPPHVPGWPDPIYTPLALYLSVPSQSAFASDEGITQNHKRIGVTLTPSPSPSPVFVRVTVVNVHAEASAEGESAGAAAQLSSSTLREYEFVAAQPASNPLNQVAFALAVRGPAALTRTSEANCGVCSPQEPPVPCAVVNGTGEQACLPNGSGFGACRATGCAAGFALSASAGVCVAGSGKSSCPDPLAWNGTACVCLSPHMQCADGSVVPCDAVLGLQACASAGGGAPLWIAGENATALAAALRSETLALEYENPVNTPEYNTPLAIGAGVASGWIAVSYLVFFLGAAYRCGWHAPLDLPTNQFAAFATLVGFTGCVCAAVAAPILVVWILLVVYGLLCVWHILIARELVAERSSAAQNQCISRDPKFWIVFAFGVTQLIVTGVIFMAYTEVQQPDFLSVAAIIFGVTLAGAFLSAMHANDAAAFVLLVLLFVVLFSATISLGVQNQWPGFWLLLVATVCVFVLVFAMGHTQCGPSSSSVTAVAKTPQPQAQAQQTLMQDPGTGAGPGAHAAATARRPRKFQF